MIVPTVLATTARRSCTLCCASDRPVAEDIAIPVTSLVALSFRTKPIGHCSGSLILSAVAAGKQGPRNHLSVTDQLSAFVARELSAKFASCSGGGDAADTHAMGGIRASVRRGDGALPQAAADGGGGRRAAGHVGAAFLPAARALRGGRR